MEQNQRNAFKRFDVVSDDSDHHFLYAKRHGGKSCFSNTESGVCKSIMREWKILEQHLPESIYVRAYERHIDLLRAAIVGIAGTPYHDGLFFFDIAFPSDYPNQPPMIHYRSFGLRLNPNLYSDGLVCLSLLNTWAGKKCEMWDPSKSTVLQLLLSLQGLVLNENPVSNEPGFRFSLAQSRAYNEYVFALTCHTTLYLIRRPPKNFEALVTAHFSDRASDILSACREYANGRVRVGHYYRYSGSSSSTTNEEVVSEKFPRWVEGVYCDMFKAFLRCGASLEPSMKHLELERKSRSVEGGIFKKAFARIKRAFGSCKITGGGKTKASEIEFKFGE